MAAKTWVTGEVIDAESLKLAVNSTGKSITLTADQSFKQGTTLMLITENDI